MKFEKWTVALAALGVVSLASVARAEEKATTAVTALTPTTIGGYVDTSAHWNLGTGNNYPPPYKFNSTSKSDGFNLDVVQLTLEKALDETAWSAGYRVDLWAGPDANALGTTTLGAAPSDLAIRQAYVSLNTPVGNGLDWKVGVFDSIIGYESLETPSNPNYTHSYGSTMEPQTSTGILASYRFCDTVSVKAGVANTLGPQINERNFIPPNTGAESYKTYMASITLTAPGSFGWLAGSTLTGGFVNGFNSHPIHPDSAGLYTTGDNQTAFYVGTALATPVKNLSVGAAFDYENVYGMHGETFSVAGYASYKATDKLSFHVRGEYVKDSLGLFARHDNITGEVIPGFSSEHILAITTTVQYELWKNVVSRVELRWDHSLTDTPTYGGSGPEGLPSLENSWLLAANIAYRF